MTATNSAIPVWRVGKPDAFLADAVDFAREAIAGITDSASIGAHLGAKREGERLVTHLFESKLAGYGGWQWYAVLTRISRSKVVTVCELGLLPSADSILAPDWVPWAERVRPEDQREDEAENSDQVQETASEIATDSEGEDEDNNDESGKASAEPDDSEEIADPAE
ncbi:DUF3027 domain-containing protein [Pseudarthrobacter sp. J1738]|uniref:DUF3027 domain-containing protein n=1 Tax=Pseudarthrobacter sp. J1738 TaxID=3420446 RepID=UPI003D2C537C